MPNFPTLLKTTKSLEDEAAIVIKECICLWLKGQVHILFDINLFAAMLLCCCVSPHELNSGIHMIMACTKEKPQRMERGEHYCCRSVLVVEVNWGHLFYQCRQMGR